MIQERTPSFSLMQAVKRRFFAMRNGDLAAQMAKGGITYRINFGLNLPQISDIARAALSGALPDNSHVPDDDERRALARLLWENTTTRESRLIAPMLLTPADLDADGALAMLAGTGTTEEADVLCHKLLRNHPDAAKIAAALATAPESTDIQRYAALRLMMNLLACGLCRKLARMPPHRPALPPDYHRNRLPHRKINFSTGDNVSFFVTLQYMTEADQLKQHPI